MQERIRPSLEKLSAKLSAGARTTVLWLMGIAGFWVMTRAGMMVGVEMGWIDLPPAEDALRGGE